MQKKKNSNKVGIAFVIGLVIFMIVIGIVVMFKTATVSKDNVNKTSSRYETIMSYDYVNNYPTTPNKVMDNYCYIMSYLYSDEIKEEEIPSVVEKSRELIHFRTLENTSLEEQVQAVKEERATIERTGSFVTNVTHSNVLIDQQFANYADCQVTEYTQSDNNLLGDYVLQMDDYKWKIYSWTLKGTNTTNVKN